MNFVKEAQDIKARAVTLREAGEFQKSESLLKQLRDRLMQRISNEQSGSASKMEIEAAKLLANICGSLGGTYRAWGRFEDSVGAYDEGYKYESSPRFGIVNSYDLVQRLVARVLFDPQWAIDPDRTILNEPFPKALEHAETQIEQQMRGPRQNDEYALADLAMIALLIDRKDYREIWTRLKETAKNQFVLEANNRVLEEMLAQFRNPATSDPSFHRFLNRLSSAQEVLAGQRPV